MTITQEIKLAENHSLSDEDLMVLTDGKVSIYAYEDLENIQTIDQLLEPYGAVILLYQTQEFFGHWVSLIKQDDNTLEFFDSLGWEIDKELPLSSYNLRVHNGEEVPHLSHLIEHSNYKVISNNIPLQKDAKDDNTCGRWAGLRVRLRKTPLKKFVELFSKEKIGTPDFWVTALTIMFS